MKILVIDHHDIPQGVAPLLHRIVPAHEGLAMLESSALESGLEYCGQHDDLDLVVLDLMLPGKRGIEALLSGVREPHRVSPQPRPMAGLATPTGGIRPQNKH